MMVKKYFALSLIAASLAVAGCSSSDDDDDNDGATTAADAGGVDAGAADAGGVDAGGADAGGVDAGGADAGGADAGGADGGTPPAPEEDMSTMSGTSILDLARGTVDDDGEVDVAGIPELSTLVALLGEYPDLLNILDDEDAALTVFAPTNDAFTAAGEIDEAAVKNILQYHVAPQNIDETAGAALAASGDAVPVANGGSVTIGAAEDGSLQVLDNDGNAVALGTATSASNGNASVYVIGSVLAASEAPVEGTDAGGADGADGTADGGDDGGADGGGGAGAAGSTYAAIQGNTALASFLGLVDSSNYQQSLEDPNNNHFVTFAPTEGTFDAATTSTVISYIHVRPQDQSGPIAAGTYNGTGGEAIEFTVAGEGETLTVNGSPATYVETQSGGALYVYGG